MLIQHHRKDFYKMEGGIQDKHLEMSFVIVQLQKRTDHDAELLGLSHISN